MDAPAGTTGSARRYGISSVAAHTSTREAVVRITATSMPSRRSRPIARHAIAELSQQAERPRDHAERLDEAGDREPPIVRDELRARRVHLLSAEADDADARREALELERERAGVEVA